MSRILVVEDSPTQAQALQLLLEAEGFAVEVAAEGRMALALVAVSVFDLVIMDIMMPGLSGHEVCRRIKDDPARKDLPVILLTQLKAPMDIIQGLECGADNFITKPYEPDYLIERVHQILERKAQQPQAKVRIEAEVLFLGKQFTISAEKEQILDLLFNTFEEMVKTNQELKTSQDRLAAAKAQLEQYAHQLEGQARTSEDKYKRLMEQANDGIFLLDPHGTVLEVNHRGAELLGQTSAEIVGRAFEDFAPALKWDEARKGVRTLLADGSISLDGIPLKRADGQTVNVDLSASLVEIGGERLILAIAHDVTERLKLEERFRQAQKLDAIGQLAGGVAHDFNNLLTVILGYSEMMLGQLPAADLNRILIGEIHKSGMRAASLTRQLLAFSRKQLLEPKVLDLNAIVNDTHRMLCRLIGEDISLKAVLEPNLGRIKADQGQIEQVIMNLAINARDAMPQGGQITIETANVELDESYARTHPEVRPGRYVLLVMSDTGCGMDDAVKAHIFEPFFTTKSPDKGTGLGLATIYGIVKQSQGHISVYSEPGQGAAFTIYLPRLEEPVSTGKSTPPLSAAPGGRETVLLVEDGDAVRTITREMLQMFGYHVLEATRGDEAIHLVEQSAEPIHLLISDVVMPGMGGRQLSERLLALRPSLKVLFFSGYMDDAVVRHGILQAEVAFLHKPFTIATLAHKVREVLDKPGSDGVLTKEKAP